MTFPGSNGLFGSLRDSAVPCSPLPLGLEQKDEVLGLCGGKDIGSFIHGGWHVFV